MKAAPNKQSLGKNMNDRPPRSLAAGKSNAAPSKHTAMSKGKFGSKQPVNTGTAKRPQYL